MSQASAPSDQPMPDDGVKVIPAATLVIFRHARDHQGARCDAPPQLLFVQRSREMRFAGGAAVFPGGRVDPADRELATRLLPAMPLEMAAARIAAIRETLEETGLAIAVERPVSAAEAREARQLLFEDGRLASVLERFGWTLSPQSLAFFAHWCPLWEGAFDTRFFITDLGTGAVDVTVDATENTRLFWASAAEALAMADRGEISVIFPTRRNLERLALYASHEEALAALARHPQRRIHPQVEQREDGEWLTIPDDLGYPVLGEPKANAQRG